MIDKSDEVFDRVMTYVMSQVSGLTEDNFDSDYVNEPSTFPHIYIVQAGSRTDIDGQDDRFQENRAFLDYEVTVYSNKAGEKRSECRVITGHIDDYMQRMNFSRESSAFVPNMANNSIARLVSRYTVLADNNNFYRR